MYGLIHDLGAGLGTFDCNGLRVRDRGPRIGERVLRFDAGIGEFFSGSLTVHRHRHFAVGEYLAGLAAEQTLGEAGAPVRGHEAMICFRD